MGSRYDVVILGQDKHGKLIQVPITTLPYPSESAKGLKKTESKAETERKLEDERIPREKLVEQNHLFDQLRPRMTGTIKVERSDLSERLDELKGQVDALTTEVGKLNKVLEQLEKKLNP